MVNFGPLTPEMGSGVWGTLANFNRFRVLALLLHRRRWSEVNKTLQDVWLSSGLVHWIYTFLGALIPNGTLPAAKFTKNFKSCVLLYWRRYCTALEQRPSAKLCGVVQGWNYRTVAEGATFIPLGNGFFVMLKEFLSRLTEVIRLMWLGLTLYSVRVLRSVTMAFAVLFQ